MTKINTLMLTAALLAGTTMTALAQDKSVQGRPMGGLAISMQDEQAMEAASMARAKMQKTMMHKTMMRHRMHHHMMMAR